MYFEELRKDQEEMVKEWLAQDYVAEFWNGVGLENTLKSISRFVNGKETIFTLWIAYDEKTPFAYLMTSTIDPKKDQPHGTYMKPGSSAISLDLLIGNQDYLGKGLSHKMIQEFLLHKFGEMSDVFIDPGTNNPKAIHVYEKAGFVKREEFIPDWDPKHPCLLMQLKMETLK